SKVFSSEAVEVIAQGEVYDDRSGLPLGGASVKLVNIDGVAPEGVAPAAATTSAGQYVLAIPAGQCVLEITKEGYTTSHREVLAAAGIGTTVFDARIAPVDNPDEELVIKTTQGLAVAMNANPGETVEKVRCYMSYPEGAVETPQAIRLALISPQAIQGRLPAGWSPLAAVDFRFLNATGNPL
ncbi:MAG: carboxypeptidase regulatory-like domain-containing protein, partial [Gammaproteobacteria bacterium]|nr:carboxypeptidase regulatory-like domain-containing protein [Gammaproteobacteria bacterium]